ncbi:MAG: hypothetical protein ABJL44_16170 [Algibacter sp.]
MAPIKFEENIKKKLENRVIEPSVGAWNTLSDRLETENKKRTIKSFWWLSIAASIVGVLFITTQFLSNNSDGDHIQDIVIEPEIKKTEVKEIVVQENITNERKITLKKSSESTHSNKVIETPILRKDIKVAKYDAVAKQDVETQLKKERIEKTRVVTPSALTFEEQKIQEVAAQINALDESKNLVTDQSIEALLQKAQREIALEKLYNDSTRIVDAKLLLESVEQDLDESFRNKVFEALKANYNKVKTAVAQRND